MVVSYNPNNKNRKKNWKGVRALADTALNLYNVLSDGRLKLQSSPKFKERETDFISG